MRKLFIILSLVLSLALIISCSPDQLTKTGQLMYKLGDAGLVSRNTKYVEAAAENVKAYITESEKAFTLGSPSPTDDPKFPNYDGSLSFKNDACKKQYLDTVNSTVENLLAARDSSAKDSVLRDALNAKYEGMTSKEEANIDAFNNLFQGLIRNTTVGYLLRNIADEEKRANLVMLLAMLNIRVNSEDIEKIKKAVETIENTELPIPFQSCDYGIMMGMLLERVTQIREAIQTLSNGSTGDKKVDLSALKRFQDDIGKSVGKRTYQTVGDKITVGILYSIMSMIVEINDAYVANPNYYGKCEDGHKYDLIGEFILTEPEGKGKLDRILGGLDAIGYIYGVKFDMAGFVAGLV